MKVIKYENNIKLFLKLTSIKKDVLIYCGYKNKNNIFISHRNLINHNFEYNHIDYENYTNKLLNKDIYLAPNIFTNNIYIDLKFLNYIKIKLKKIISMFKEINDARYILSKLYRDFLLENLKIIIGIYTCESDKNSFEKIKKTDWYKKYKKYKNIKFLNVYAGYSDTKIVGDNLLLNTEESYSNLSMKTYHMINYINSNFDFDYFLKN